MQLCCPNCNHLIPAEDINIVRTVAKCSECHNIFTFTEMLDKAPLPVPYKEEVFVIPDGIELLRMLDELEITVSWRNAGNSFVLFFSFMWNAILAFILFMFFGIGGTAVVFTPITLFFVPFVLVGAYTLYAGISQLVNKTYINVDGRQLSVRHKPFNFLLYKDRYMPNAEVKQLYVRRYEVGKTNETPVFAFALDAIMRDGKTVTLVQNIKKIEHGRFIEQQVEQFLNIVDEKVAGEWA
jgi:hypothetical protein